jgi:predicted SAM-dependent methyltransferase
LQERPTRLHLGCGEKYLEGYVNIDYPPDEHPVQVSWPADVYADIRELSYEPGSVAEVRLHHVFEHFDRVTALGLLIDWYTWLEEGGILMIETPDFEASVRRFLKRRSRSHRGEIVRHIFGSQEAAWAFHADGWYEEKFHQVLEALGYELTRVKRASWRATDNITITARKPSPPWLSRETLIERAGKILALAMIDQSESEVRLHQLWHRSLGKWRTPGDPR